MKNRIIGWVQGASTDTPNNIYNNGIIISANEEGLFQNLYQEIVNRKAYMKIYDNEGLSIYANMRCEYLIYSNFSEKDVVGRRIAYMCKLHCPTNDIEKELDNFATAVKRTIWPDDIIKIHQAIEKLKMEKIIVTTLCMAVVTATLLLFILK